MSSSDSGSELDLELLEALTSDAGEIAALVEQMYAAQQGNQRDFAIALARQILERDADQLDALHVLHFMLVPLVQLVWYPGQDEEAAEQRAVRDRILALTEGAAPTEESGEKEAPLPQRARGLALATWVLDQPPPAEAAAAGALLERARQAMALRSTIFTQAALRRAELAAAIAEDAPAGYRRLLEWVAAHPVHSVTPMPGRFGPASCQGLEALFALPGFAAWAAAQVAPAVSSFAPPAEREAIKAVLLAAGEDAGATPPRPGAPGRAGRLAALAALGLPLDVKGYQERAPLHLAAKAGSVEAIELLAGRGGDVRVPDSSGDTPLHYAAEHGQAHVIAALVRLGAYVDARNQRGEPALHQARSAACVHALVDAGAAVDATRASDGSTALHLAMLVGSDEVVLALLERGADPRLTRAAVGGREDAVAIAIARNRPALARRMGAEVQRGVDLTPLRDALVARGDELMARWYWPKEYWAGGGAADLRRISAMLDAIELDGVTWEKLARQLQTLTPWCALGVVELVRDLGADPEPIAPFTAGPRLIRGDLVVAGDLAVTGALLVTGDLIVHGTLRDSDHESLIAVGGALRAHAVMSSGELMVAGDLEAAIVWGFYNDHSLLVGGTLRCTVLVNDDHDLRAEAEAVAHSLDLRKDSEGLRKTFADELFDADGDLDLPRAVAAVRDGGGLRLA